jgi:hypothetical protein
MGGSDDRLAFGVSGVEGREGCGEFTIAAEKVVAEGDEGGVGGGGGAEGAEVADDGGFVAGVCPGGKAEEGGDGDDGFAGGGLAKSRGRVANSCGRRVFRGSCGASSGCSAIGGAGVGRVGGERYVKRNYSTMLRRALRRKALAAS